MKKEDLYRAVGSVEDTLLDEFEQARPQKHRWLAYGAMAACFCLLAAGGLLYSLNRKAPDAPAPTEPIALQEQTTAPTQPKNPDAPALTPLSELPQLQFEQGEGQASADIALPNGYFFRALTDEKAAGIWGQETLNWEGYYPEGFSEENQQLVYDGTGSVWVAYLFGSVGDGTFTLTLAPEQLPPNCVVCGNAEPKTFDVYDTPVTAIRVGNYCEITFVRGEGERAVGARLEAHWTNSEAETLDLLTRIVSQSLRPDGVLQLDQLKVSEVPEWFTKRLTEEEAYAEEGFGEYLPMTLPSGYVFESAGREYGEDRNYMGIGWTREYDNFYLTVDKRADLYGLVHADEVEKYDYNYYGEEKPDIPDEYWESWSDPLFYAEEMSMEVIERRIAEVDMGNVHLNFRVLYPDGTVVRVSLSADREELPALLSFLLP